MCDYTFYFPCYLFGSLLSWHVGIGHGVVVFFLAYVSCTVLPR
jgi:hypothetical protein